jgi:hypothetical protein
MCERVGVTEPLVAHRELVIAAARRRHAVSSRGHDDSPKACGNDAPLIDLNTRAALRRDPSKCRRSNICG